MNWLEYLGTAAVGSFIGLIAKELLDLLKARTAHRRELQKRYFDAKLEHTIEALRVLKAASITLRDLTKGTRRQLAILRAANGGSKELGETLRVIGSQNDDALSRLREIIRGEAIVRANLTFFYGERWNLQWANFEKSTDATTDAFQAMFVVLHATITDFESGLASQGQVAIRINELDAATERVSEAARLQDLAMDQAVAALREDFDVLDFR
jgi:hypothetical protein